MRSNGRVFAVLPPDLDPHRKPHYGPGRRQRFIDREQAVAWLDAEVRRRRAPPAVSTPDETLGGYLARWYGLHEDEWHERTAATYAVSIRRWRGIGHVRLRELTRDVIAAEVAALRRTTWQRTRKDGTASEPRRYSPRTIQQAIAVLHQALEDLIPDVLTYNPARIRRRGRGQPPPEQPVWSSEHATRFLAVAERHEPRYELGFRLILYRALRIGEVVALTRSDVNEQVMTLTIDQTAGMRPGQDGPTKTRKIRDIPLSADLLARIKAHQRRYPAPDPHLFTLGGRPIWTEYLRQAWHRVVRLAGVPAIAPKDGRATCATLLLDAGEPLPIVAQLLGHASVATTAAFYQRTIKRRAEQVAQVGERLDARLGGATMSGTVSSES